MSGDPVKISSQPPAPDIQRMETEQEIAGGAAPLLLVEDLPHGKRPITRAERWFDTTLYGGLMGVFNAVYSMWLGDEVREGRGKAFFERTSEKLAKAITPAAASPAKLAQNTLRIKATGINVVLTGCGIMLLFPMKWFENRKPQFVRWIHDHYTASGDPQQEAKDQAALAHLDKTPTIGWGSIATGRAVGMVGPFMVSWHGAGFVQRVENAAEKFAVQGLGVHSPRAKRYSRMMSLELLYTGICTAGLYVYTHLINPPNQKQAQESPRPTSDFVIENQYNDKVQPPADKPAACVPCKFLKMGSHAEKALLSRESAPALQTSP